MKIPNLNRSIDSIGHYVEFIGKKRPFQILCGMVISPFFFQVAFRFIKGDVFYSQEPVSLIGRVVAGLKAPSKQEPSSIPPSQEDLGINRLLDEIFEFHIFHQFNTEELPQIARVCRRWNRLVFSDRLSYHARFPNWLKDLDERAWEKIDLKKYGLDLKGVPRINRFALTKALKPLAIYVEGQKGITNMIIPKGLTLNIVLKIAEEYSIHISKSFNNQITARFGDIPVKQTCVLFFTNDILSASRDQTAAACASDLRFIGNECKMVIQKPGVRDFMAFLALTYLNSPQEKRTHLYSPFTSILLEEMNNVFVYGGFDYTYLYANISAVPSSNNIGYGASGSSEDISREIIEEKTLGFKIRSWFSRLIPF